MRERNLFMMAARVADAVSAMLLSQHLVVAVETLSLLADTEDFQTHKQAYVATAADAEMLVAFKTRCLTPLMTDMEKRKAARHLVDAIDRAKRQFRLK